MPPLYLSRLRLRSMSREVRRDLANCDSLHKRLLMVFPDLPEVEQARDHFGVLYRLEPSRAGVDALVQSHALPDWTRLPSGYLREPAREPKRVDDLYDTIAPGQVLIFRLRANPTRRISTRNTEQPEQWRGKRVELRREEDQLAWLRRKGETAGFALLTAGVRPDTGDVPDVRTMQAGNRVLGGRGDRRLTFGSVVFEGRLRVTAADAFRRALAEGLGSGKAFGFGLLSIAPAPSSV